MASKQNELKKVHKGKWIPNALTISRLIFAIAIVLVLLIKPYNWGIDNASPELHTGFGFASYPILIDGKFDGFDAKYDSFLYCQFMVAGGLFVIGCLTDFLDGYLSRKYNWVSNFGKIMDPVADKVLVDSTLIVLCVFNAVYVWIVIIIIARDILVDATRMVKAKEGVVVPANVWGKLKTVFQMLGIMMIMFAFNRIYVWSDDASFDNHFIRFNEMYNPATATANIGLYLALVFSVISGIIYEVRMLSKPKQKPAH